MIALKALAREPGRRYASAAAFADDLRRHLGGWPIRARADTLGYRARRFVQRNRAAVLGAAFGVVALAVGLGMALGSLERERAARVEATVEARQAQATRDFVVGLFGGDGRVGMGLDTPASALLAGGLRRVDALGPGRDAERSLLLGALRDVHAGLGQYAVAESLAARAVGASSRAYGPRHVRTLVALAFRAQSTAEVHGVSAAIPYWDSAVEGLRAGLPETHKAFAWAAVRYGETLAHGAETQAHRAAAARLLDEADALRSASSDPSLVLSVLNGRAHLVEARDGLRAAGPLYAEAYQVALDRYGDGPQTLSPRNNWGDFLLVTGQVGPAVGVLDTLVALERRLLGPDHPGRALPTANAATAHLERGDLGRALALSAEADRLAGDGPAEWVTVARLQALRASGDVAAHAARALRGVTAETDPTYVGWARAELALARIEQGRTTEAEALARQALAETAGEGAATAGLALGRALSAQGDRAGAETAFRRALATLDRAAHPPAYRTAHEVRQSLATIAGS